MIFCSLSTSNSPSAVREMPKCGSGRGAGPSILVPSDLEFAAVARACNHFGVRLPLRNAAKMRADCGDRVKAFRHAHDINLLFLKKRHRMDGIEIGIAGTEGRRGLKQDVGRKILIGHSNGAETGNSESTQRDLIQEITPSDPVPHLNGVGRCGNRGSYLMSLMRVRPSLQFGPDWAHDRKLRRLP